MIQEGSLLWTPSDEVVENANITHYMHWLNRQKNLEFSHYSELWRWSVEKVGDFWESLFEYFDVQYSQGWQTPLANAAMPGAIWFPGAKLNYAENIFAQMTDKHPMMLYQAEDQPLVTLSWQEICDQVNRLATALREMGVQCGDRVVAFIPNIPEAVVALLAVSSIGAIWSSCSPDFGSRSVLDRFVQIEPKVLIAVDGYNYGGKTFNRRQNVAELQQSLPTLQQTILIPHIEAATDGLMNTALWDNVLTISALPEQIEFEQVPFDHPLWVLYSSGTTGLPKPIVHGHGGIILEHAKATIFHNDLKPGDHFFWYSSTGWMMWNYTIGSLLSGATIILYNGSPTYPDTNALFDLAERSGMTYFGTSAAFVNHCIKEGITPNQQFDLSRIRGVGSTGSPLSLEGFQWIYDNINPDLALESLSGGTDLCTAFVGGARTLSVYAGELQGASLGAKVEAYDEAGQPVINEVGELVITQPMPSMPITFWNDPDMERYKSSYFEIFPGIWRHGDWIKINERGGCVIYGRSDSTINRMGIRMGTSEIYQVVESFEEIQDSLIIDLEMLGRKSYMPLFVVMRDGKPLNEGLKARIKQKLREEVSPRHIPNDIIAVAEIPYTLSGKKLEVPIRRILLGMDVGKAVNPGALRNPQAVDFFV